MTQQQLEYFMELARTLNFTKVSKRFLISQTAVSKQIQSLEEEVGVKLFNRTSRQVELTSAGRSLLQDVPGILANMYEAVSRLQKASTGFSGNLRIGFSKGTEHTGFHECISRFCSQYPYVSVSFSRMNDFNLYMALDSFELDIAFGQPYQSQNAAYERVPMFTFPLLCAVHPEHPFVQRESVSFQELENERLLLMSSNSDLPESAGIRLGRLSCLPLDFEPKRITWTDDVESAVLMAMMGMGVAPLPAYMLHPMESPRDLRLIPIQGGEKLVRIQAITRGDNSNPALKKLLPYLGAAALQL